MGLFNDVVFKCECPKCGAVIGGFQTKDEINDMLGLSGVEPNSVRNFYSICRECKTWIEFNLVPPADPAWILSYGPQGETEATLTTIGPRPLGEFKPNNGWHRDVGPFGEK